MKTYYYYGNDSETVVELEGKYYLVQSEDLGDRGYEELSELPDSMVPIDVRLCTDIEIPADLSMEQHPA